MGTSFQSRPIPLYAWSCILTVLREVPFAKSHSHAHLKSAIFLLPKISYVTKILRLNWIGPGIITLLIFQSPRNHRKWDGLYLRNSTQWLRVQPSGRPGPAVSLGLIYTQSYLITPCQDSVKLRYRYLTISCKTSWETWDGFSQNLPLKLEKVYWEIGNVYNEDLFCKHWPSLIHLKMEEVCFPSAFFKLRYNSCTLNFTLFKL